MGDASSGKGQGKLRLSGNGTSVSPCLSPLLRNFKVVPRWGAFVTIAFANRVRLSTLRSPDDHTRARDRTLSVARRTAGLVGEAEVHTSVRKVC